VSTAGLVVAALLAGLVVSLSGLVVTLLARLMVTALTRILGLLSRLLALAALLTATWLVLFGVVHERSPNPLVLVSTPRFLGCSKVRLE
jgi:hypothetical protein